MYEWLVFVALSRHCIVIGALFGSVRFGCVLCLHVHERTFVCVDVAVAVAMCVCVYVRASSSAQQPV